MNRCWMSNIVKGSCLDQWLDLLYKLYNGFDQLYLTHKWNHFDPSTLVYAFNSSNYSIDRYGAWLFFFRFKATTMEKPNKMIVFFFGSSLLLNKYVWSEICSCLCLSFYISLFLMSVFLSFTRMTMLTILHIAYIHFIATILDQACKYYEITILI